MGRRVFYSFHFEKDYWRTQQVRQIGTIEGDQPVSKNDWEQIRLYGDPSIQRWIDNQLDGKTCTIVLIGSETAGRRWVNYEIEKSWKNGLGLLGVFIHNLLHQDGRPSLQGRNPFENFSVGQNSLSRIVRAYNPPEGNSKSVYNHIAMNLENWVEEAIRIRSEN